MKKNRSDSSLRLFTPSRSRRLRVADEGHGGANFMDAVPETPPLTRGSPSTKRFTPRRIVSWLQKTLKPTKELRALQRRQNVTDDLETPMDAQKGGDTSRQLHENDTSFELGVSCDLLYLIEASKNELDKMVKMRKEMEMLIQNVKGEMQSKDALLKLLKHSDDLAPSTTNIQEVSSSSSLLSIYSPMPYVLPKSDGNIVNNDFLEYDTSEQDECSEEISDTQAEFEVELQRLQIYSDEETASEDAQEERVKVTVKDSHSKSHSSSFGEIIMEPEGESSDASLGVPPVELERRLHELLQARLQEQITNLEFALECTAKKLIEKEIAVSRWKDIARLILQHVPETSRITLPLDPEIVLKLSQVIG